MSDTTSAEVIVVGIDGSDGSRRALRWAVEEAQLRRCTVEAVTAWPDRGAASELSADETEEARRLADDIQRHEIDHVLRGREDKPMVSYGLVHGDAVEALVRASARARLLVVGSHGTSSIRHATLGSVSEACSRLAACPVVVVPGPITDQESPGGGAVVR